MPSQLRDCLLQLFSRDGPQCLFRRPLVRAVRAIKRLTIVKDGLIEDDIPRAGRTLPRDTAVRMECPAKAAKDGKHRHKDNRQASPDADMAARLPDRRPQDLLQQPDEQCHQEDCPQEARPELILLHSRVPDGCFIILHAVEQHDVEALMKNLIIGDADDKEQCHQPHSHAAQHRPDARHRPPAPNGIRHRTEHKRKRHKERRRLQTDPSPEPESLNNITCTSTAQLPRVDQQKRNAKDHEQDVDVQKQLRILLQRFKKTQTITLHDVSGTGLHDGQSKPSMTSYPMTPAANAYLLVHTFSFPLGPPL